MEKTSLVFLSVLFISLKIMASEKVRTTQNPAQYRYLAGVRSATKARKKSWDQRYSRSEKYLFGKVPEPFLVDNIQYIRPGGRVLDVGMGEGRNAVYLASKKFQVVGIDISSVALRKANSLAKEHGVRFQMINASVKEHQFGDGEFDALICFYFVDREIIPKLMKWLKPGGVLIFESFTKEQKTVEGFPLHNYHDSDFLKSGELLKLFEGARVLKYEGHWRNKGYRESVIVEKRK